MCAAERINISPAITHSLSLYLFLSLALASHSITAACHHQTVDHKMYCVIHTIIVYTDECIHKQNTCICVMRKLRKIMIIFRTIHLKKTVQCIWLSTRPHFAHTQDWVKMTRYLQQNVVRATLNYLKKNVVLLLCSIMTMTMLMLMMVAAMTINIWMIFLFLSANKRDMNPKRWTCWNLQIHGNWSVHTWEIDWIKVMLP